MQFYPSAKIKTTEEKSPIFCSKISFEYMIDSLATSDHMILTGLILATKRPTVVAFSSTGFVMDTSFQRPNYDTQKAECKAQHEKGRLQH